MSENRNALKIVSVIIIAVGLYDLIPGLILLFSSASPDIASPILMLKGVTYTAAAPALVFGIMCVVSGLICTVAGLLGWRGAKDPSKIGPFLVLAVTGAILALLLFGIDLVTGTWPVSSAIEALFVIVIAVTAFRIRKESRLRREP